MSSCVRRLFLLAMVASSAMSQVTPANPPADHLQRANQLFVTSDWKGVLSAYEALARAFPNHALSRFRVGVAQLELGQLDAAESNLRLGERLGVFAGMAAYRLAQLHAERGQEDKAIAELERAASARFAATPSTLESDKHLASLKRHARWAPVVDQMDAVARPCMHDLRFREFDFWIGDWDVRPTGQAPSGPAARNTVTLEENGCVVMEHWNAPGGSRGQSFNIYDRSIGMWRQTWVDASGGQHDYRGNLKDGNMAFVGDVPVPNGQRGRVPVRLTFFKIGSDSVRQFSEISTDSGKTWRTNYDLTYVRRTQPSGSTETLTAASRAQILALDSAFVRGWLRDDTASVLGIFAPNAVLQPPNVQAVTGHAAIRSYWFPDDGSTTRILAFDHQVLEIVGSSTMAVVRGASSLRWRYTKGGTTTEQSGRSADVRVYAADPSGKWRVIRQIWTPLP
jgi:ketosteroid isomerase-like protein